LIGAWPVTMCFRFSFLSETTIRTADLSQTSSTRNNSSCRRLNPWPAPTARRVLAMTPWRTMRSTLSPPGRRQDWVGNESNFSRLQRIAEKGIRRRLCGMYIASKPLRLVADVISMKFALNNSDKYWQYCSVCRHLMHILTTEKSGSVIYSELEYHNNEVCVTRALIQVIDCLTLFVIFPYRFSIHSLSVVLAKIVANRCKCQRCRTSELHYFCFG